MPLAQFANPAHTGENFTYGALASDAAGLRLAISIFADRPHVREQMREDAEGAGFRIAEVAGIEALLDGDVRALGDVVLLDCPHMSPAVLAGWVAASWKKPSSSSVSNGTPSSPMA